MEQQIALGRVGHYFTPNSSEGEELSGSCQKADVVAYGGAGDDRTWVSLSVYTHAAEQLSRTSVPVAAPATGAASFHLNRDCPWQR